jgi:hypothetical protein
VEVSSSHTVLTADVKKYLCPFSSVFWDKDEITVTATTAGALERPLAAHCGRSYVIGSGMRRWLRTGVEATKFRVYAKLASF